jgi:glycosyltransferase involved in cell wall biosynthesis
MNSYAFAKTDTVFTLSEGMKSVLSQYVMDLKIKVVPIWVDNEFLKPIPVEENIFIRNNGLSNKFIVLYSGNLGKTGDVECMVELAKQTKDKDIQYVIIGEGVKRDYIERNIVENKLSNCILLPWQSAEMLPHSLSAASLAVVSLGKNTSKIAMPSKLYGYLAVGAPVLSLADADSELAKIVNKYNLGQNFEPERVDEIVKFIVSLKSDKRLTGNFSANALNASKNFTKENVQHFVNS